MLESEPLSKLEADAVIRTRMDADQLREADSKSDLLRVPALKTMRVDDGERQVVLRKVAPPAELPERTQPSPAPEAPLSDDQFSELRAARVREAVNLQLHAYVYDGAYSEITLRHAGAEYTIWTNLICYLSPIGTFQTKTRDYACFGMTTAVSREAELSRIAQAQAVGIEGVESRWKSPPVKFVSTAPEYVLATEDAREVPEEVYRQLDDLMAYCLTNEAALHVAYKKSEALQAARERYEAAHPPEPQQDIVLNYSRMRGKASR